MTERRKERWFYSKIGQVSDGGTGSSTAATARTNLGLAIGTNVQAWDIGLDDIAALENADGNIIVGDGTNWVAESGDTARTSLGVGSGDSPQFAGIELGHADDTTLTRVSAGKLAIEGTVVTRSVTYTVAASDAPTHVKAQADYVCDGTDDHIEIQAAIDALPTTGGEVKLSSGTFNCEVQIDLDSNQTIRGCGMSTILTTSTEGLIFLSAVGGDGTEKIGITISDFHIANIKVDGNGIVFVHTEYSLIQNVHIKGMFFEEGKGAGGIVLDHSSYNEIVGCVCEDNIVGITLDVCEGGCMVVQNILTSNAIGLYATENNHIIIGNQICKNVQGLYFYNCFGATAANNVITENTEDGLILYSVCQSNEISGNTISLNGHFGIWLKPTTTPLEGSIGNSINGNVVVLNSQSDNNTYDNIYLEGASNNSIQGNTIRAGSLTNKPRYGINIADADCDGNKVINNDLYDDGFGTALYNDAGTGTIYVDAEDTQDAIAKAHGQDTDQTLDSGGANEVSAEDIADGLTKLSGIEEGADVTADHDPKTHAASHAVGGDDTIFPADPGADKVLGWDDSETALVWQDAGAGGGDVATDAIWDAKGDLAVGTGADTAVKLAIGTDNYVLRVATDTPAWEAEFDATTPSDSDAVSAGSAGSAATAARRDHAHKIDAAIADDAVLTVDQADAADNDYAKFTANGIEGRSYAEVATDLLGSIKTIQDADGDTKIQIEESADEDKIRLDVKGVEAFVLDDAGVLTLAKQSAVRAYLGTNQSINTASWTKVLLDTESFDIQSEFVPYIATPATQARFTAKTAGIYLVTGMVLIYQLVDGAGVFVQIRQNGNDGPEGRAWVSKASESASGVVLGLFSMAVNDYLELWVYHTNGSARNAYGDTRYTFLSIAKIA